MIHTTSDPKQKKSEDRGIIVPYYLVGFYMLSRACCEEMRSLWYTNGRTKSKISIASRGFHY
jgi:hypothetical protein